MALVLAAANPRAGFLFAGFFGLFVLKAGFFSDSFLAGLLEAPEVFNFFFWFALVFFFAAIRKSTTGAFITEEEHDRAGLQDPICRQRSIAQDRARNALEISHKGYEWTGVFKNQCPGST